MTLNNPDKNHDSKPNPAGNEGFIAITLAYSMGEKQRGDGPKVMGWGEKEGVPEKEKIQKG